MLAGPVRGISIGPSGDVAVSCSTDCSVRLFRLPFAPFEGAGDVADEAGAVLEFQGKHAFRGIDHHWAQSKFATAGAQVRPAWLFHQSYFALPLVLPGICKANVSVEGIAVQYWRHMSSTIPQEQSSLGAKCICHCTGTGGKKDLALHHAMSPSLHQMHFPLFSVPAFSSSTTG